MKKCIKCNIEKSKNNFASKKVKNKNWLQPYCKACQKIYRKDHYIVNRQKYIDKAKAWRKKEKEAVRILKDKPCMDCKIKYPYYIMQFDHRGNKKFTISQYVGGRATATIIREIKKCDIVCANCHAERTWNKQNANIIQR